MFKKKAHGLTLAYKAFVGFLTLWTSLIGGFLALWAFLAPTHVVLTMLDVKNFNQCGLCESTCRWPTRITSYAG